MPMPMPKPKPIQELARAPDSPADAQPTSAGSSIAESSTSPISRRASRGSTRPAPSLTVDSAPHATPKRRHWSGGRPS